MIDHSKCDHERTRAARSRCRRQQASGEDGGERKQRASVKTLGEDGGSAAPSSLTPAWKADECHVCGVERIEFAGTDAWTGLQVLVGEKCAWRVKRSDDFRAFVRR